MDLSFPFDFLGILFVTDKVVVGTARGLEKFVQLGVNGLSVAVFGPLDDKGHSAGGKRGQRVPLQAVAEGNCEQRKRRPAEPPTRPSPSAPFGRSLET